MGVFERFSRRFAFGGSSAGAVHATSQTTSMNNDEPLPTRLSLLDRLKDAGDHASWEDCGGHRESRLILAV